MIAKDPGQTPRDIAAFVPALFLLALVLGLVGVPSKADAPLPPDSIYQLDAALTDQDGHASVFANQRGPVRIVSMFYADCPYVCPMIIDAIRNTERELGADALGRLRVTLISLDPERDTPAALHELAVRRELDLGRWSLFRASGRDVRRIAAVLGIQYRQLANKDFNHSSVLILIDASGRVLARTSHIGTADPEFVAAVRAALAHQNAA